MLAYQIVAFLLQGPISSNYNAYRNVIWLEVSIFDRHHSIKPITNLMKNLTNVILILTLIVSVSCTKESEESITKEKVTGFVQKGPFINGTSILMSELNKSLEQTGKVFTTQITDNRGSFEIKEIALSSSFVEFAASGFYYNEVEGDISPAQLTLYALSDLEEISSVNVNILTHLEKRRVEYLVENGSEFTDAKNQAQEEILALFGITDAAVSKSESLDISVNSDGNAILLAISLIIQGERSVGDLTELLSNISSDLELDGIISDENIIDNLRLSAISLNLEKIRSFLELRYTNLGLTVVIPDFESFVNEFILLTAKGPECRIAAATNVDATSAIINGFVNPNSMLTTVTFEYGTTQDYGYSVVADQSPVNGNSEISISSEVSDLEPGTKYFYKIIAENDEGINQAEGGEFTTSLNGVAGYIHDIDGNMYNTIGIGDQVWMSQNLTVSRYNDGTAIENITVDSLWSKSTTPSFCWYNNDSATYSITYGALYNWYAVSSDNLCPEGWHVPSMDDWGELVYFLGGSTVADDKMIETENGDWTIYPPNATNESGFTALPAGFRDEEGHFARFGLQTVWWTSNDWENPQTEWQRSQAYMAFIDGDDYWINITYTKDKTFGGSIRCIKDH